jgi:LysM repeat protein
MTDSAALHGLEPRACPFVALDDDRDRRLDAPDDRHRCYAEPDPQPRALAHQRAYCLAPAFAACPIFLDWAARAAADPVGTRSDRPTVAQLARPSDLPPSRPQDPASRDWAAPPPWSAGGFGGDRTTIPSQQLSAFPDPEAPHEPADRRVRPDVGSEPETVVDPPAPRRPGVPLVAPPLHPIERAEMAAAAAGSAEAPPFLAARQRGGDPASGRPLASGGPGASRGRPTRQASPAPRPPQEGPEWTRPRRREAYPRLAGRVGLRGVPPVALAAVGLALAALLLFLLPTFLFGGGDGGPSPTPSVSVDPTPSPEPTPSPSPTPLTYTVRSGDTMSGIAREFGLTVEQVACANGIDDPNRLSVGQILVIPDDDFECGGSSPSATGDAPTPSPGG